jgi:hypothetical protein
MRAATGRWQHYRRTRRVALAMLTAGALIVGGADIGGAQEDFNAGTGTATANGYKVNPVFGNLSFGMTAGLSIAGHQNTVAQAISRSFDTGVIGDTMAGEGCKGGDPTWARKDQPKELMVESSDPKAANGKESEEFGGAITMFAKASPEPLGEAITTVGPMGDPALAQIDGGQTITSSGVVDDGIREARAVTVIGSLDLIDGMVSIGDMTWEAIHRSGAEEQTIGRFTVGSLTVNGEAHELEGDEAQQAEELNTVLNELGFQITMPRVRVESGIVFVDPMKVGIIKSDNRDSIVGPIFEAVQPFREQLTEAMLEQDCSNATYITVLDIAIGTFSGAGSLNLELGGVQATTAELDAFELPDFDFPDFEDLPPVSPLPDQQPEFSPPGDTGQSSTIDSGSAPSLSSGSTGGPVNTGSGSAGTGSSTPSSGDDTPSAMPTAGNNGGGNNGGGGGGNGNQVASMPAKKIADISGERGGLLAAISALGLALLLITAEGDRRKMRRALRDIPTEA